MVGYVLGLEKAGTEVQSGQCNESKSELGRKHERVFICSKYVFLVLLPLLL